MGSSYAFEVLQNAQTNMMEGGSFTGSFVGNGQPQLLAITVTNSGPLLITLNNAGAGNVTALYARLGSPPTQGTFGWESINPNSPNQQILISSAIPGTYYVLVYGNVIPSPGAYTVQVVSADVFLLSATPSMAPTDANIALTLSGGGFLPSTSVALISTNGTSFPAASASVDSFTHISATFASNTLPAGVYSVVVTAPAGGSTTLSNVFQALSEGAPNFTSSVVAPWLVAPGIPATAYGVYANTGNAPMPAPLVVMTAEQNGIQGGVLGLDPSLLVQAVWTTAQQPIGFGTSAQFLASGKTPGILQPGEALSLPVYWATFGGTLIHDPLVYWNLGVLYASNSTPIDWPSLESAMQPSGIPSDAWNAIFTALTNEVGSTWGDYVTTFDSDAAYLGRLGLNVQDITKLLPFQIMQADGLCPIQTLASSVDASVIAPGLSLTFSRSYGERISQRYAMGPLGRGWSHNWQYSLQQGNDGTVTIFGPGCSQRIFQPDKRGGYFNQAGDYGTLAADGSGGYTLTEKTGAVSEYAANGTLNYIQDLNGNRITLGYSGGLLTSLTHSSGQYIQLAYNGAGLIQTITDQLGHQTILTYDAANQHLIGAQYFDGRTVAYKYNTNGSVTQLHALTASSTSCCNWRYFTYDSNGRVSGTYLAENAQALVLRYGTGGQVNVTDALTNSTQFFYDYRGLLYKTVDALGNSVCRSFDGSFNLVSVTDPADRSYDYSYDSLGNLVSSDDPLGDVSQFTYTAAYNRLGSVTDAKGNATQYGYDADANLQSITYTDGSVENWTYDAFGDPQTWKNRRGHQTIYTNNVNGQITGKQFADGSLTSYSYDSQGNLTNAATFDTNLSLLELSTMTYDGSNRLVQITYTGSEYLNFTYDSDGRRISSTDQLGHSLYYTYDDAGRFQSMTNELSDLVVLYQYDPTGRIATKTLGNGMFTTYQYDSVGWLLNMTNALANGTLLSYFNYTYDSRGRRTSMTSFDGQWTYTYDDVGQLTHAVLASTTTNIPDQDQLYVYDSVGNRIQTIENGVTCSYTANNLNQYVSVGATNYTFDTDGNLIQEISSSGTTTYQYNDENRLIALTSPQGNWQYTYDALENRNVITVNGTATRDVVDPFGMGNVVGEYDLAGTLLAHYDHALGLISRTDSGGSAYYAADAGGNVTELVLGISATANSYSYSVFGNIIRGAENLPNPFQFAGQWGVMQDANGVEYMRSRYYRAFEGAFASSDPLRISPNGAYRYASGDPINRIDPVGLEDTASDPNFGQSLQNRTDALNQLIENIDSENTAAIQKGENGLVCANGQIAKSAPRFALNIASFWQDLMSSGSPDSIKDIWDAVKSIYDFLQENLGGGRNPGDCGPGSGGADSGSSTNLPNPCLTADCGDAGSGAATSKTPADPNGLNGPAGFMTGNYVLDSGVFSYEIFFENETNATAPAQIVQITDPLSTNLNWSTFQLSEIAFGNTFIAITQNDKYFQTNLPFSYAGVNFQVQINAGINLANGQVFANFFSVDPATGLPPSADVGFLPPEDGTGRGKGQVSYIIQPQPNLATGLQIPNVAYIQFDENPVIATDQVDDDDPSQGISTNKQAIVTIDNSNPYSSVASLPAISTNANFTVCWSGTNNGPAIVAYDIYVETNDGPWNVWLADTTNPCETFSGQNGQSYGFYSVAHDGAGRVQANSGVAQASTIVMAPPFITISLTNDQVVLAWPTNIGNFVLQTTTNLASHTNWNAVTNTPTIIGSSDAVTVPITNTSQFFRLESQ